MLSSCTKDSVYRQTWQVKYGWTITLGTFCDYEYVDSPAVNYNAIWTAIPSDLRDTNYLVNHFEYTGEKKLNRLGEDSAYRFRAYVKRIN